MVALVIGYGNPLRQDDSLGWHVAERLIAEGLPAVDVLTCHQLTPELAERISRTECVVFVDARAGPAAGRMACRAVAPHAAGSAFSHHVAPGALLMLARALYGACPPAWVVTVDGAWFGHGPDLSPAVAAAVPAVVQRVNRLIGRSLAQRGPAFDHG